MKQVLALFLVVVATYAQELWYDDYLDYSPEVFTYYPRSYSSQYPRSYSPQYSRSFSSAIYEPEPQALQPVLGDWELVDRGRQGGGGGYGGGGGWGWGGGGKKKGKGTRRARERRRDAKKEVATIIMEDGIQLTFPLTVLKSDGTDGLLQ